MQNWSTTAVTPLSYDTEPTILITFDNAKYMFNVGENTNRAFLQSSKNWKKMRGLFLTQVTMQRASGLGGMLMSFADAAIDTLDIVGPPGLRHYLASMRTYLYREQLNASMTEHLPDPAASHPEVVYKDENITVYSFLVSHLVAFPHFGDSVDDLVGPGQKRKRLEALDAPSKVPKYQDQQFTPQLTPDEQRRIAIHHMFKPKQLSQNSVPSSKEDESPVVDEYRRDKLPFWFRKQLPSFSFPPTFPQSSTLAYIVVGPRIRGRVDGKKLNELGVPRTSIRARLSLGETIQFEVNGPSGPEVRTLRPEDCMSRSDPPAAVIILDVPSVEMIPSVIRSFDTVYKPFRSMDPGDLEKHTVRAVYHLLGQGVLRDERYIEFMKGFPETAEHIISSPEHSPNPLTFTSHGFNQYRLSQLDAEAFPIPKFSTSAPAPLTTISSLPPNSHILSANLVIPLRPAGPPKLDSHLPHDQFHPAFDQPQPLPASTAIAFEKAKEAVANYPAALEGQASGVTILPLGTGSAVPNKYRNVLSTLIKTPSGNILLDSGEGTTGQLTRRFGRGGAGDVTDVLRDLKCIFVSHVHGDHHIGLAKLLRQRKLLPEPPKHPLYVVSIRTVHLYLKECHELEDIGLNDNPEENGVVQIISDALNFRWGDKYPNIWPWFAGGKESWLDPKLSRKNALDMCRNLDLNSFETIDVDHRTKAFGVFFRHRDGWSIAFSGDTMPTPNLAEVASGATLLIHEASMGDDQEELARMKAHSTVGQAIQTARDMNAKNVLLTHFSARYPKMPPSVVASTDENTIERKDPVVTVAFDLAELDLDKMWKMNLYLPAIEQCFKDSMEEGDEDLHAIVEGSLDE